MLTFKNPTLGKVAQSRTAVALFAATLLVGGSVTEASAKSHRYHHHGHRHFHHASNSPRVSSWRDANAAFTPSSASGRTFSGIASFYGNESGSKTASGQRFNQNLLTAAHRTLPFGTRLRVTRGARSVVVTINDRGPFVRGRVLDLSTAAAREVGLTGVGVGRVTAEVL
jgi:rare lipoprotein A